MLNTRLSLVLATTSLIAMGCVDGATDDANVASGGAADGAVDSNTAADGATSGDDAGGDDAGGHDAAVSDVPVDTASASGNGSQSSVVSTQTSGSACEVARKIVVGVWGNGGACNGDPAFTLTVDLSYTCFGWERSLPNGTTRWNSATNFRCYKDRVCYSQHPGSGTCKAPIGTTDKEWRVGTCSAGTMIMSGAENCPEAPAGGCPLSAKQKGSQSLTCDAS